MFGQMVRRNPVFGASGRFGPLGVFGESLLTTHLGDVFNDGFGQSSHEFCKVDVKNTGEGFVVTADLPGITKEDLDVTLENDVLTISGERSASCDKETNGCCLLERSFGKFSRSLRLSDVDESSINASLKDGVLTVSIKKAEDVKPRKINIQ